MKDYLLEFKNITFSYERNQEPVLQHFSMDVPSGKKCVVLGQNGSGKSTVLLLANGLLKPTVGNIVWKGTSLIYKKKELKELRQKTGLFFQNADEMLISPTVIEDLSYGLLNAGYQGEIVHEKVEQIITQYNLETIKNRPIHHLSLGEKRRVALAGVMVLEPELLLLDEPTTYLDPLQMNGFIKELNRIHKLGTTVVMSTHDLELAYQWAEWVFVLEKGRLVFQGTPDELFLDEKFVYEKGLSIPVLFQLKQLLKKSTHFDCTSLQAYTKEEIISHLKCLLTKEEN